MVVEVTQLEARLLGQESPPSVSCGPLGSDLPSLCPGFLPCKRGAIVLTSYVWNEDGST